MSDIAFRSKLDFLNALQQLEQRFANSKAELSCTLEDPELGVEGFLVVWNTDIAKFGPLGPCGKGGTRIHPNVTLDEISLLAKIMALKNAAAGLPMGGSKSGLRANPEAPHFEKQYRRFIDLSRPYLRENGGIFGGFGFDIGAQAIHARWACDELGSYGSFTGKPLELGGTDYDREGIAGLGVVVAAREALAQKDEQLSETKIAVQGIGAMGSAVLRYVMEDAAIVVALADPRIGGCLYAAQGLPQELCEAVGAGQLVQALDLVQKNNIDVLPLEKIFEVPCDILFPCAMQNVITEANWQKLQCRYVIEGANSPCTREAQKKLYEAGVLVIPDFIANPGGVIAAFVELTSVVSPEENLRTRAKVKEAKELTKTKISENVKEIMRIAQALSLEPRDVGMLLALQRIYPG